VVIELYQWTKLVAVIRCGDWAFSVDKTGSSDQMWWLRYLSGQNW